jgi:hypothetical protein
MRNIYCRRKWQIKKEKQGGFRKTATFASCFSFLSLIRYKGKLIFYKKQAKTKKNAHSKNFRRFSHCGGWNLTA